MLLPVLVPLGGVDLRSFLLADIVCLTTSSPVILSKDSLATAGFSALCRALQSFLSWCVLYLWCLKEESKQAAMSCSFVKAANGSVSQSIAISL